MKVQCYVNNTPVGKEDIARISFQSSILDITMASINERINSVKSETEAAVIVGEFVSTTSSEQPIVVENTNEEVV